MRQWTAEERRHQARLINTWKPWMRSSGPKTLDGKHKSSKNAYIHGGYGQESKAIRRTISNIIREYKDIS